MHSIFALISIKPCSYEEFSINNNIICQPIHGHAISTQICTPFL